MNDIMIVAAYICNRYEAERGERIDEMRLHKLMYFAQRESLIVKDEALFEGEFQGWRFGPVLPQLRNAYQKDEFDKTVTGDALGEDRQIVDAVINEYADKDSWSLSRLTHGEISWKRSRKGVAPSESSSNRIPLEDIRADADRIRQRQSEEKAHQRNKRTGKKKQ